MSHENRRVILRGGRGGKGNQHISSHHAGTSMPNQEKAHGNDCDLELKVIADVGLVGFPTWVSPHFIQSFQCKTQDRNYHFTTLNPNLGVVDLEGGGFVMADIPGLLKEHRGTASHEFLRHIERTKVIVHLVMQLLPRVRSH